METAQSVIPGDIVGQDATHICGVGCYVWKDGTIRSSLAGKVSLTSSANNSKGTINVISHNGGLIENLNVGDKVLCRVLKINSSQAVVNIIMVGDNILKFAPKGLIRREDVAGSTDSVAMHQYFRPGDIVRAAIVSYGDSRYYLTTDGDDYGVVGGISQNGNRMVVCGPQVNQQFQSCFA